MSNNKWSNSQLGGIGAIHIDTYAKWRKTKKRCRATKLAWVQHYLSDDTLGVLGRYKRSRLKSMFRKLDKRDGVEYVSLIK